MTRIQDHLESPLGISPFLESNVFLSEKVSSLPYVQCDSNPNSHIVWYCLYGQSFTFQIQLSPKILTLSWKAEMVSLLLDMPQVRSSSLHSSLRPSKAWFGTKAKLFCWQVDQKKCKDKFHEVTCIHIPGEQHFGLMCQTTFSFSLKGFRYENISLLLGSTSDSLRSMDYGHA